MRVRVAAGRKRARIRTYWPSVGNTSRFLLRRSSRMASERTASDENLSGAWERGQDSPGQ